MSMAEFFRMKEKEAVELAKRYERCPEDQQKAAGAKEAREAAEFYRKLAEKEEGEQK